MKRISHIFLSGAVILILLAAACTPVEGVPNLPGSLQQDLTASPAATTDPSQATATNTTLTPSIPVTGLEVILLNCPYCVDNIAHDQLLIPREATFRVTSPPDLVRDDDDDDGEGGRRRIAQLSGAAEVPGPGDPDGSGTAMIRLQLERGEVCFDLTVSNIGPATAAHIHEGADGVAGPVVVPLSPAPTGGSSSGCISDVDAALLQNIAQNPEQYYVNVHNEEFPDGAIRGQLGHVENDDEDDNRLGCRVIDRFRDKKLVLCRAEQNTTITMDVCLDDNNCTEVQLTLQSCALTTGTPTATATSTLVVTTTTTATETLTPIAITASATATSTTATATSTVAPATATATPTVATNTNTPVATGTNTATPTSTATSTPTP